MIPVFLSSCRSRSSLAASVAFSLISVAALAQTTEVPPAAPDVIELSPFEVRATDASSYDATMSVTGTRVAANLIELPYNVNVVTSQFLEDFLADTLEEQFEYVSSFAPEEDSTNAYLLRGFRTNFQLRNGYARSGMFSKVNISRVEVIKGPAAAVYGRTQPGGVINYITKAPRNRPTQVMTIAGGTDNYYRFGVSSTGPIVSSDALKIRYRVDTDVRREEFDQGGPRTPFTRDRMASGVVDFRFNQDRTAITVEADRGELMRLPVTRAPIQWRQLSTAQLQAGEKSHLGLATDLAPLGYNNLPGTYIERVIQSINLGLEHQINSALHFRIGGDYADRNLEAQEMFQFVRRYNINTGVLTGRIPQLRTSDEIFKSAQADLLASFWLGRTEHRLLLTADYFQQHTQDINWRMTDASANDPSLNESVLPVSQHQGRYTVIVPGGTDPAGRPFLKTTDSERQLTTRGIFGSWRMGSFNGKLITMVGLRAEESDFYRDNRGQGTYEDFRNSGTTPSYGVTYRVRPDFSVFANYSKSYYPSLRTGVDEDFNAVEGGLPNEEGSGVDIGVKSALYDGKLAFTATSFFIKRRNVAWDIQDATLTRFAAVGLIEAQGYELDFAVRPWEGVRIFGAYSYIDTEVKRSGFDLDLVGRRWERVPTHRGAVGFTARVPWVRRLHVNGGVRYTSDTVFANGTPVRLANDPVRNARSGNDGQRDIIVPSFWNVNLGTHYTIRGRNGWQHRFQFNIKNVLNDDTIRQSGIPAEPRRFIFTYRLEI